MCSYTLPISPCSVIEHISKMIIPQLNLIFAFMVALLKFYEESEFFQMLTPYPQTYS